MNNEKQILKNQETIMMALSDLEIDSINLSSIGFRINETKRLLNPKEDVPYEDSLNDRNAEATQLEHLKETERGS